MAVTAEVVAGWSQEKQVCICSSSDGEEGGSSGSERGGSRHQSAAGSAEGEQQMVAYRGLQAGRSSDRPQMHAVNAVRRTVHYYVYWNKKERAAWRPIPKPTHVWTNATQWEPKGSSGTGVCDDWTLV